MQIVITVSDKDEVSFSSNTPITYAEATDILCTTQLILMKAALNQSIPEEHKPALKEYVYDMYNTAASNVLDEFEPGKMRKDLTEEAIYSMENKILDAQT